MFFRSKLNSVQFVRISILKSMEKLEQIDINIFS